ncbi:MAG: GYF domain-containing protein [Bacteriovoracia bacterium]
MENTSSLLFDNVSKKYFVAMQDRAAGPYTAQEVYEMTLGGSISALNFVWCQGWKDWIRIIDLQEFAPLLPPKPSRKNIEKIEARLHLKIAEQAKQAEQDNSKKYYLYFNDAQYGPFAKSEVLRIIESGKVNDKTYIWVPGWENWQKLSDQAEFAGELAMVVKPPEKPRPEKTGKTKAKTKTAPKASYDKRFAPRKPLVARLYLHDDQNVILAVCRDISIGGMQVLTDRIPGPVGTKIKLNVSPTDLDPSKGQTKNTKKTKKSGTKTISAFIAEGEVVRIMEDQRGFSFRFLKISSEAKKAIQDYVTQN